MRTLGLAVASALLVVAASALAAPNDLVLNDLVLRNADGTPQTNPDTGLVMGDQVAFQALTTELGQVFAPRPLTAAETPGHAGFDIGIDYTLHFINSQQSYWTRTAERALEGRAMPPLFQTLGVRVRKGLPFSLEVGGGGQYLFESHMFAVGADAKWSLNEGFIWFPDLALLFSVNRLIGNDQIDLTMGAAGAELSKTFGLFGMMRLCPYAGYNFVVINAASAVIDPDESSSDNIGGNFTFDQIPMFGPSAVNGFHRAFVGLLIGSFIFDLSVEGDFNFAGAQAVHQLGFKLALDF
ncbi:MAG: hypothetical protein JXR83_21560 [Deltaproteobacteria bacterium]|nr:hypothetical protein [Deltaproteobacteria bacterium]